MQPRARGSVRNGELTALVAVVLSVPALELGLQGAAAVVWLTRRTPRSESVARGPRIVCLGDSNTYGIYVRRNEAYPAVLGQLMNVSTVGQPVEIVNLGYPG